MQLYDRGIRRRLAPMLGDRRNMELAYSMLFSLPGTPVIRYGDEIGMGENLALPEREAVRTPMQWSGERNGGFSLAEAAAESGDHRRCLRLRAGQCREAAPRSAVVSQLARAHDSPAQGDARDRLGRVLDPADRAQERARPDVRMAGQSRRAAPQLFAKPQEVVLRVKGEGGDLLTNLLAENESRAHEDGAHRIALEEFGYRWFRVGGLGYALRRQPGRPQAQSPA